MKRERQILIYIAIAVIFSCIGCFIGAHINQTSTKNITDAPSVAGVYYTTDWNGEGATLLLNDDGTCKYASSSTSTNPDSTWVKNNNRVIIDLHGSIHEAIIINDGLLLHNALFQKVG